MHWCCLTQSRGVHIREQWCEIQKMGKLPLPNNVPYDVQECPQSESNSKLNISYFWFVLSQKVCYIDI